MQRELAITINKAYAKKKKRNFSEIFQIHAMLLPGQVLFLLFCIYPIIYLLYYSFMKYDGIHAAKFIGFTNYMMVIKDKTWWNAVINTGQLGIIIPLFQVPMSLILAVILNTSIKGKGLLRATFFVPNITSPAIMGIIFFFMFATDNGIVNEYFKFFHIISTPVDWFGNAFTAKAVIVLFRVWYGLGFYMVLFLAALQRIPKDVYESAKIDGSSSANTFFKITLPLLGKMFQIISTLSILDAMKLFDSIRAITNGAPGGKTEVITMYIFSYFFEGGGGGSAINQEGYASAVSVVATVLIALFSLVYLIVSKKFIGDDE